MTGNKPLKHIEDQSLTSTDNFNEQLHAKGSTDAIVIPEVNEMLERPDINNRFPSLVLLLKDHSSTYY